MTETVLITGARSGIGLATLRRFAEAGNVTAADRPNERALELESQLAADGPTAKYAVFDLRDRAETDDAVARVVSSRPDSPYWAVTSQRVEFLGATIWKDSWIEAPAVVAEAIYGAAINPRTPLFVPVGRDTKLSASLRGRDALQTYKKWSIETLREIRSTGAIE